MRRYEVVFIVAPQLQDDEAEAIALAMRKTVERKGATVEKVDKWGKHRLAYRVQKHREGHYFLFEITGAAEAVNELERKFKQTDEVIRFMTVRTDLEQKALAKRIAMRQRLEAKKAAKAPKGVGGSEASAAQSGLGVAE